MTRYMAYLFAIVRKKWSTYLIPLFGALVLIAVLLAQILTNDTDNPVIGNVSTFYYFLPFVFGAMFVGTKALNIFKDGEADGTELLIVSKPISRGQVVMGKFFTLYLLIFGYAIWSFVTIMAIGFVDENATTSAIMNFSGGYAIGSLIIMIIFSAIIVFFASVLGKIGTMSLSIVIPALLPILSFILVPVGHGSLQDLGNRMSDNRLLNTKIEDDGTVTIQDPKYMYDPTNSDYQSALKEKKDGFYKYIAYGDIWQHMFGFYSILEPQKLNTSSQGVKVKESSEIISDDDGFVLTDSDTKLKYLYVSDADDKNPASVSSKMTEFFKLLISNNITLGVADNEKDFYNLEETLKNKITAIDSDNNNSELQNKINDILGSDSYNQDSAFELAVAYFSSKKNVEISNLSSSNNELHLLPMEIAKSSSEVYTFNIPLTTSDKFSFIDLLKYGHIEIDSQPSSYSDANSIIRNQLDLSEDSYKSLVDNYGEDALYEFATVYLTNAKGFTISDIDTALTNKVTAFDGNYLIHVYTLEIEKYVNNAMVIAIYSIIAILISGLVIFRYYRRDFK